MKGGRCYILNVPFLLRDGAKRYSAITSLWGGVWMKKCFIRKGVMWFIMQLQLSYATADTAPYACMAQARVSRANSYECMNMTSTGLRVRLAFGGSLHYKASGETQCH